MTKTRKITILFMMICLLIGVKSFATTGSVNAPNGLVLRERASKGANPITTVSDKETVEIEETLDEWYKVKYNSYEGYLYKEYVDVKEEKTTEKAQNEQADTEVETVEENIQEVVNVENSVYPQQATTNSTVKIYVLPSITATVLNLIDVNNTVTVTKTVNSWAYIKVDENISGWVRKSLLNISDTITTNEETTSEEQENENKEEINKEEKNQTTYESKKGYINANTSANVRSEASTSSSVLTTLTTNTEVTIVGEEGDWYKVTYGSYTGYISKALVSDKQVTTTSRGNVNRTTETENITETENTTETTSQTVATDSSLEGGAQVADLAQQCIGCSYTYGGTSTSGFDCSGFTQYVYSSCGYSINRTASAQSNNGYEVSKDELIPGDLLLFDNTSDGSIGHVGIYIGGGTFVHAANSRRGVTTDTINSGYYNTYYYSARRIAN